MHTHTRTRACNFEYSPPPRLPLRFPRPQASHQAWLPSPYSVKTHGTHTYTHTHGHTTLSSDSQHAVPCAAVCAVVTGVSVQLAVLLLLVQGALVAVAFLLTCLNRTGYYQGLAVCVFVCLCVCACARTWMNRTGYCSRRDVKVGATSSSVAVPFNSSYSSGLNTKRSDWSTSVTCAHRQTRVTRRPEVQLCALNGRKGPLLCSWHWLCSAV